MTATVRHGEVTRFVVAVREALQDLAPEEVDELTDDLEADLDDALTDDSAGGIERFGSPQEYAAELRAAAGLAPRADLGGRRGAAALAITLSTRLEHLVEQERSALAELREPRWWQWLRDFAATATPLWWAVRGWVGYRLLAAGDVGSYGAWTPLSFTGWVFLLLLVALSIELGRRRVGDRSAKLRLAVVGVNVLALLLFLPMADQASRLPQAAPVAPPPVTEVTQSGPPSNGLWLNGSEVRNVFPYDSAGHPLVDVQLFDEQGRSLEVGDVARTSSVEVDKDGLVRLVPGHEEDGLVLATVRVPTVDGAGQPLWNVFPLREQPVQQTGDGVDVTPLGPPAEPMAPFHTPTPVAPPGAVSPGAGAGAGAGASPSSAPAPSPSGG
jgi:hypothetical protein